MHLASERGSRTLRPLKGLEMTGHQFHPNLLVEAITDQVLIWGERTHRCGTWRHGLLEDHLSDTGYHKSLTISGKCWVWHRWSLECSCLWLHLSTKLPFIKCNSPRRTVEWISSIFYSCGNLFSTGYQKSCWKRKENFLQVIKPLATSQKNTSLMLMKHLCFNFISILRVN